MSDPFSSALHPEIPLGVKVPQAAGASSALNSVGVLSEVQNRLNQARLFQQTFAAQQRFGQIMSAAGSVPEGLNAASQDPSVLGFFPEGLARLQQFEQSRVATAGEQQKQVNTALEAAGRMSAMGYQDPGMLPRIYQLTRDMLPKGAANAQASQALDDYYMAITDHAPGLTPDAVKSKIQANIGGAMTAAGMSPDMQAGVVPRTEMAPLGGTLQPILRAPGSAGGAATPVGQGLPLTQPPGYAQPGSIPVGGAAGPLGTTLAAPSGSAPYVGGIDLPQRAYLEHRGADMADYQRGLDSTVDGMYNIMQNVQETRQALQNFRPGGGADTYARIAQFGQAIGLPQDLVDRIGNGNLAATQEFNKLAVQNVMGQIQQQLPKGSRLAQYEFQQFSKNNPNIETDPRAIDKIHSFWGRLYNTAHAEQSELNNYLQTPGAQISQWPSRWQDIAKQRGYISPDAPQASFASSGGAPAVRGTSPSPSGPLAPISTAPPPAAIAHLKENPALRDQFDQKYGQGAAARALGQ